MNRLLTLTAVLSILIQASAKAELAFEFGQDDFIVGRNQSVEVDLFLSQDDPTGDPIDLTVDGLISVGVEVIFNINPPSDPATVASLDSIIPDPAFDDTLLGEELFLTPGVSAGFIDGIDDVTSPITGQRIRIGSITFQVGSVVGEVTTLRAGDIFSDTQTVAGNFTSIDEFILPGFATLTVVPEPSSLSFLVLTSAPLICVYRPRRDLKTGRSSVKTGVRRGME